VQTLRDYLKIAEAEDVLGVSINTLRKWADEGKIQVYVNPANRYRLFRRSDLESFLKKLAKANKRNR
jgi:excisionase family DNA binding protein